MSGSYRTYNRQVFKCGSTIIYFGTNAMTDINQWILNFVLYFGECSSEFWLVLFVSKFDQWIGHLYIVIRVLL